MKSQTVSKKTRTAKQNAGSHNLMQAIHASSKLTALLSSFGDCLFSLPDVDGGAINLVNEAQTALVTAHLKLPAEFDGVQNGYRGFEYRFDQPDINLHVYKTGLPEMVSERNPEQFVEISRMRFERWNMLSMLVCPLNVRQADGTLQTIGTVYVFSQNRFLTLTLAEKIAAIAEVHAAQISALWYLHQVIERDKIAEAMSYNIQRFFECVMEMNSLTSVSGVYTLIANEFIQHFGFDAVSILLADEDSLQIVETAFSDPFKLVIPRLENITKDIQYSLNASDGQCAYVYTHNQHFHVADVALIGHLTMSEKDRLFVEVHGTIRTLLIVPIRMGKAVIGTIAMVTLDAPRPVTDTDVKLIEMLASFSSTAIRNAKAHELVAQKNSEIELLNQDLQIQMVMLDQVARKDHLTGLNNFGNFEEELKRRTSEYSRATDGNALALVLFDVDNFKLFNDKNGHLAGNDVLKEVAERIQHSAREMDFVARYGGEEFVMILPQCDRENVGMIAERILSKIADEDFIVDGRHHKITISGGCAQYMPDESPHDFINRADAALYNAKRNGRNRIEQANGDVMPVQQATVTRV